MQSLVQLGSVSQMLALHVFHDWCVILSATIRVRCSFARFGMCLASVGHVTPHIGAEISAVAYKPGVFYKIYAQFMKNV